MIPAVNFMSVTQADGELYDLPVDSVVFLEALGREARADNPGCRSGLFFDFGSGLQALLVQEPYGKLKKIVSASGPARWAELTNSAGNTDTLMLRANLVAVQGTSEGSVVTHRLGGRAFRLAALERRDEVREAFGLPEHVKEEINDDDQ